MYAITAVPALQDNYIWMIHNDRYAAAVDPSEAQPVLDFLTQHQLQLRHILCTHRHHDHVGGIEKLRAVYNVPVHGRKHPRNPHITHDLREGERLRLDEFELQLDILETPGHLDDHIVFVAPDFIFCGDVLFGAGCGKSFEGTLAQLHHSLQRLAALPDATLVYCAHEYTEYNLPFALLCEPNNQALQHRNRATQVLRAQGKATVPSTIALEKSTNPFFRCASPELRQTLRQHGLSGDIDESVFVALRQWRDRF